MREMDGYVAEDPLVPAATFPRGREESSSPQEHRADPALRIALENLDAVRSSQPSMDDFALENYLGHRPDRSSGSRPGCRDAGCVGGDSPMFSLDLLMFAASDMAVTREWPSSNELRHHEGGAFPDSNVLRQLRPIVADSSRSTSLGSTQISSFNESIDSASSAGNDMAAAPPALPRAIPPRRPPMGPPQRKSGRQRPVSASRGRQIQAAVESAAADLAAYAAPRSAR